VEVWQTSNLRPLRLGEEKKKKKIEDRRKKLQGKNIMAPLLHRAAIKKKEERNYRMKILWSALLHRATIKIAICSPSHNLVKLYLRN